MKNKNNDFKTVKDREVLENDFTFLAGFGLNDELREGVEDAILKLSDG